MSDNFKVFITLTDVAYNLQGLAVISLVIWLFLTSRKVNKKIQAQVEPNVNVPSLNLYI